MATPTIPHPPPSGPAARRAVGTGAEPGADVARVASALTRTVAAFGSASVVSGALLAARSRDEGMRAFGRQTGAWGAINLAISGVGAVRSRRRAPDPVRLRRTLLVNAALDVGYVAAGAHVVYHATTFGGRVTPAAARGHGWAVVVQGVGLLALDLGFARRLATVTPP